MLFLVIPLVFLLDGVKKPIDARFFSSLVNPSDDARFSCKETGFLLSSVFAVVVLGLGFALAATFSSQWLGPGCADEVLLSRFKQQQQHLEWFKRTKTQVLLIVEIH